MPARTHADALADPTSNLARMVKQVQTARAERIARARALAERDGLTLEEALHRVWGAEAPRG